MIGESLYHTLHRPIVRLPFFHMPIIEVFQCFAKDWNVLFCTFVSYVFDSDMALFL
jgi:hypothetical protein